MNRLVAVVDDDPSMRRSLVRLLHSLGYESLTFGSAEDLLASENVAQAELALLDLRLPGIDGFELQRLLASEAPATRVIFITAHDSAANRERARLAGAVALFGKPFEEESLIAEVRGVLGPSALESGGR